MATAIASPAQPMPRRRETNLQARQTRLAYILLIPTFVVLILVAFYPLGRTFFASFTDEQFAHPGAPVNYVGLQNYQNLLSVQLVYLPPDKKPVDVIPDCSLPNCFYQVAGKLNLFGSQYLIAATDPDFLQSVANTLVFTVVSVILELTLGLIVALVVSSKFRARGLMRTAMLVPWAIPTVVSTKMWQWILKDNSAGVLNDILVNKLHLLPASQSWTTQFQIPSIIMIDVWKTVPFMALLLLAGLQTIPGDVYEAGAVDGATGFQQFLRITLPLLRPTIVLALIFRTLDALRAFDVFSVLFGYDVRSIATYTQEKLVGSQEVGYSSAIGVIIFILLFAFTIIYMTAFRGETD